MQDTKETINSGFCVSFAVNFHTLSVPDRLCVSHLRSLFGQNVWGCENNTLPRLTALFTDKLSSSTFDIYKLW